MTLSHSCGRRFKRVSLIETTQKSVVLLRRKLLENGANEPQIEGLTLVHNFYICLLEPFKKQFEKIYILTKKP